LSPGGCEFCEGTGGAVLWQNAFCRVVLADEPGYPGFCRVILAEHVREMTDLQPAERARLVAVVFAVEEAVRATMRPDKVNLASLGNVVAHLHWHVIARFADDRHFPASVWSEPRRAGVARTVDRADLKQALRKLLPAVAE